MTKPGNIKKSSEQIIKKKFMTEDDNANAFEYGPPRCNGCLAQPTVVGEISSAKDPRDRFLLRNWPLKVGSQCQDNISNITSNQFNRFPKTIPQYLVTR